jgi:4-hydroxy-tetrahydrodipicolinate synthase
MKKELYPLNGIITTVITPFLNTPGKEIDWESYRRELRAALDAGVSGFLVPCMASEMPHLSHEEIMREVSEAVEICDGKALVIPSITAPTQEARLQQCKEYLSLGVDGLNLNMEFVSIDDYMQKAAEIDALKPRFLCIQDISMTDDGLPDELIVRLFEELETVRCAKIEVKDPGPKYTRILKATDGRLAICGAWGSSQSIEAYDRGIHALMPSGMFELFVNVYRLYHAGRRNQAMELFFGMLPVISFTRQSQPLNRYFHKLYLKKDGVFADAVSREQVFFDEYHQRYADDLIDYALKLRDRIPEYWK